MEIKVRLFATLREGRGKEMALQLEDGTDIRRVIEMLGIKKEDAAIILVNGRNAEPDKKLADKDTLSLFPPLGGG